MFIDKFQTRVLGSLSGSVLRSAVSNLRSIWHLTPTDVIYSHSQCWANAGYGNCIPSLPCGLYLVVQLPVVHWVVRVRPQLLQSFCGKPHVVILCQGGMVNVRYTFHSKWLVMACSFSLARCSCLLPDCLNLFCTRVTPMAGQQR